MKERTVDVVLHRDHRVFVFVYSRSANGPNVSAEVPKVVASISDAATLGAAVVDGLYESNSTVVPARNWRADPPERALLDWLGLRTYRQFQRGARSVSIGASFDEAIAEVVITPEHNVRRGGFTPISEERFSIAFESPEQLGRAVQAAMAKATL